MSNSKFDTNLLCRPFRYRPRFERDMGEDFLTEAYANVLRSEKTAAATAQSELFRIPISNTFDARTQTQYGGDRPDMEFRDENCLIFQENKVGAALGIQVKQYQELMVRQKSHAPNQLIVSCVLWGDPPESHSHPAFPSYRPLRWEDVYRALKKHLPVTEPAKSIWEQFLVFMEYQDMQPFDGLKKESLDALKEVKTLRVRAWQLLECIKRHLESEYQFPTPAGKASDGKVDIYKWVFDSNGVRIWPVIVLAEEGIFFELWLLNETPSRFDEASKLVSAAFEKRFAHLVARTTPERVLPDFFDHPNDQIGAVTKWIDSILKELVDKGLIQLKRDPSSPATPLAPLGTP